MKNENAWIALLLKAQLVQCSMINILSLSPVVTKYYTMLGYA